MKRILLSRGFSAMVDDADFEVLNQWKWHVTKQGRAARTGPRPERRTILMHRLIMDAKECEEVDHRDFNPLNNQRFNLRLCTTKQNRQHRRVNSNNTSGFKGVWRHGKSKWAARIGSRGSNHVLGSFNTPRDAATAYDLAAIQQWGEFAVTNQSLGLL